MGRYHPYPNSNRHVVFYKPDNTEKKFYFETISSWTISDILDQARDHFGLDKNADMSEYSIEAQHIHTRYIGYDAFDPDDWDNFIVITKD